MKGISRSSIASKISTPEFLDINHAATQRGYARLSGLSVHTSINNNL